MRRPTPPRRTRARDARGFTLIELMIVVAIFGILAVIAIPQFAGLLRKAAEGGTKGNLGAIRGSLSIYYGDMEGVYPSDAYALTLSSKYLAAFPVAKLPNYHPDASSEELGLVAPDDTTSWAFDNVSSDQYYGQFGVNCTHTDAKGSVWTSY